VQPDRLWAVYQPIFARTGALVGFEALARLADGTGGPIAPDVFIPIAEETGMIRALGAFMLDQAIGQLASWRSRWREFADVTMAVNVSALQVGHASLADDVRWALAAHGLRPRDLVLELTETCLLQAGRSSIAALQELRADGMSIDIDDFGVGYASLRYLATMPVSGVKIDKSFTAGLPEDTVSRKIVRAIAALAADLELECTVEGVETAAQQAALPDGVRLQGWHTGRPMDPADVDVPSLARSLRLTT
jgi:EAL domain-containing protein (putative c-di-GMP-specific phosphodiesterase class I)